MRASATPAAELTADLRERWVAALLENPLLETPMLRPELFQIVGCFNPRTFVAVVEESGRPSIFFPFHRPTRLASLADPVPICDYQAFITPMSNHISVRDVLRAAGLRTWIFENLIAPNQVTAQTTTKITRPSWRARLHTGFATYAEELQRAHSSFKNITRNLKVIARDHGDMRFVPDCSDPAVVTSIFSWKAQRFNGGHDVSRWIVEAVDALRTTRTQEFSGVLSALYVGDRLAAAHFGIRSGRTLFYWFPAFNPEFGKYTPGHLLVVLLLRHLQELGCDALD